jgi:hypothetical protein
VASPPHGAPFGRRRSVGPRFSIVPARHRPVEPTTLPKDLEALITQLDTIEARGGEGMLELPEGDALEVSNLDKVLWPSERLTKGDLLRYYVTVSSDILPTVADRPLVMRRFPNGITNKAFYQQRAPDLCRRACELKSCRATKKCRIASSGVPC